MWLQWDTEYVDDKHYDNEDDIDDSGDDEGEGGENAGGIIVSVSKERNPRRLHPLTTDLLLAVHQKYKQYKMYEE